MTYCQRCGAKLADDAQFCGNCGAPVVKPTYTSPVAYPAPPTPMKPIRKDPLIIGALVLIAILIGGFLIAVLLSAPFATVNINQSYQDNTSGINKLNLNVESQALKINVFTQNVTLNNNFLLTLDGTASKGINGGSGSPIQVTVNNNTVNHELTITMKITQSNVYSRYNLNCNLYLNPTLIQSLNVTSQAGQISLTADKPTTFESISLQSSAGTVQANLDNVTIGGDVTLRTQAGTVDFRTNEAKVEGNNTVTLQTNAGSVDMDITQTSALHGNLRVNAVTDLGSVNVGLVVDDGVGARLTSQTNLGNIHVDVQHFSGNQSPIQSNNYPAASNIQIDSKTNLGSINIIADYQSSTGPSLSN